MGPGLRHFTHLCGLGQLLTRVSSSDHVSFTAGTHRCSQMAGHLRLGHWKAPEVEVCWDFRLDAGWAPGVGSDVVVVLLLASGGVTTLLAVPLGASGSTRRSSPSWSRSLRAGPLELECVFVCVCVAPGGLPHRGHQPKGSWDRRQLPVSKTPRERRAEPVGHVYTSSNTHVGELPATVVHMCLLAAQVLRL